MGRNLATKLWNAARFTLSNAPAPATTVDPASLGPADRWILSRVHAAITRADEALAEYRFSEYAAACYDLLWRDYCDWYLEAVKPTAKGDPRQQAVMLAVLDAIVRLLHPAMPFVTEALWTAVRDRRGGSHVPGLELSASELLATAAWPQVAPSMRDPHAEEQWGRVQSSVVSGRSRRGVGWCSMLRTRPARWRRRRAVWWRHWRVLSGSSPRVGPSAPGPRPSRSTVRSAGSTVWWTPRMSRPSEAGWSDW
jgi:valyl-tRNA synthetase